MSDSNPIYTKDLRRQLRRDATSCELLLWHYIKGRQIEGLKFRRQHGYGPYVMDFFCTELRWCVEVDGKIHDTPENRQKDADRTSYLNQQGITVTRMKNEELENGVQGVVERLHETAMQLAADKHIQLPLGRGGTRIKKEKKTRFPGIYHNGLGRTEEPYKGCSDPQPLT